jgi:Mn-dependent DtxR family transcriptional regulator
MERPHMTGPDKKDYLQAIYELYENKGYARVVDIATSLQVSPSMATRAMQNLAKDGFGLYEKYRGFTLTAKGTLIVRELIEKQQILGQFFLMIGISESTMVDSEIEKIEHRIADKTVACIADLIHFFESSPSSKQAFEAYKESCKEQPLET